MTALYKTAAILMVLCMIFRLAVPVHTTFASDIEFEYEEEAPKLTQTENQGRDTGFSGGNNGGGDIPGGNPGDHSPGFWENLWNWGKETVKEGGSTVAEFIGDKGESLGDFVGNAGESLGDAVSEIAPNLGEKIKEYSEQMEGIIKGLTNPDSIGDFLKSLGEGLFALSPAGMSMMLADLLSSGAVDAWNAAPDWVQGLLKGLGVGLAIAAAIIGGALLLGIAGTTLVILAGIGALGAAIYGAIVGGDNFNALTAGAIALGTVFIPLAGKMAGALLSTRAAFMLGTRSHLALSRFAGWAMTKLSAGWASLSGLFGQMKWGALINGGISSIPHFVTLIEDPSAFDMKEALVDITTGAIAGGLIGALGSGFMALGLMNKLKRVFTASGIAGGVSMLRDWALGDEVTPSSFLTTALITAIFLPLGSFSTNVANKTIGKTMASTQKKNMNIAVNAMNSVKQTIFSGAFKKPIMNGFHKLGEMISDGWNRLIDGNVSSVDHSDTEQLQHDIDEKTNSRSRE
ncbi:hypothetical protein [Salibacterium sp. K-3]